MKEGETANLTCNATGYPEPTITWYREKEGKRYGKEKSKLFMHLTLIKGAIFKQM